MEQKKEINNERSKSKIEQEIKGGKLLVRRYRTMWSYFHTSWWLNNQASIHLDVWNIYGSHHDRNTSLAGTLESWGYNFVGLTKKLHPHM